MESQQPESQRDQSQRAPVHADEGAKGRFQQKGSTAMDFILPVGILVAWIVLQVWVLPRFGVST